MFDHLHQQISGLLNNLKNETGDKERLLYDFINFIIKGLIMFYLIISYLCLLNIFYCFYKVKHDFNEIFNFIMDADLYCNYTDLILGSSQTNSNAKRLGSSIFSLLFQERQNKTTQRSQCNARFLNMLINVITTSDDNSVNMYLYVLHNVLLNKENAINTIWNCIYVKLAPESLRLDSVSLEEKKIVLEILWTIFEVINKKKENITSKDEAFSPSQDQLSLIVHILLSSSKLKNMKASEINNIEYNNVIIKVDILINSIKREFPQTEELAKKEEEKNKEKNTKHRLTLNIFNCKKNKKEREERKKRAEELYPDPPLPNPEDIPEIVYDFEYAKRNKLICAVSKEV